jgi:hypothetical protein
MFFRLPVLRIALVVAAAGAAVALGTSSASAISPPRVLPPPGGPPISCQFSGTSGDGFSIHESPICLSFQTAFFVYTPNWVCNGSNYGYTANIYRQSNPNTPFWTSFYCPDGVWHFSSAWASNEARHSEELVYASSQAWGIIQYKH